MQSRKLRLFDRTLCTLQDESGTLKLWSLSFPIFMNLVFNLLLGTVNTVALTYVSPSAVTAVNVSNTVIGIPTVLLNMIVNGMLVLLSLALGGGRKGAVGGIFKTGLIASVVFSGFLFGLLGFFAEPILRLMGLSGATLSSGVSYLRIRALSLSFAAVTNCITARLRAHGFAAPTMIAGILSNAVNAAGSVFAVSPFYKGNKIIGVAVMTVVGQLCGMIYAVLRARKTVCGGAKAAVSFADLRHILAVGVPGGISLLAYNISTVYSTSLLAKLGEDVINVKVYTATVSGYTYLFGLAVAQSAAMMIGRHAGAGHFDSAQRLFRQTVRLVPLLNAALSFLVFLFSCQIMQIFTNDPAIITAAHTVFLIDIAIEIFRGVSHVGENALCSVEDTVFTSAVSIPSSLVIGIFGCWFFSIRLGLGLYGYYAAAVLDELLRSTAYRIRFQRGRFQKILKSKGA